VSLVGARQEASVGGAAVPVAQGTRERKGALTAVFSWGRKPSVTGVGAARPAAEIAKLQRVAGAKGKRWRNEDLRKAGGVRRQKQSGIARSPLCPGTSNGRRGCASTGGWARSKRSPPQGQGCRRGLTDAPNGHAGPADEHKLLADLRAQITEADELRLSGEGCALVNHRPRMEFA